MPYLKFISDKNLITAVKKVVNTLEKATDEVEEKFYSNVIDPFSALFHATTLEMSFDEWTELEKSRQVQKTFQNAIGNFHQDILGSIHGWTNLGTGKGLDVENKRKKIIAEIKNKHNTTKGNHQVKVYDDMKTIVKSKPNYTGYYVAIIPKGQKQFNKPFTPSEKKKKRPINQKIRLIDGVSFYKMATRRKNALAELFKVLPIVISKQHKYKINKQDFKKHLELFERAFSTE